MGSGCCPFTDSGGKSMLVADANNFFVGPEKYSSFNSHTEKSAIYARI